MYFIGSFTVRFIISAIKCLKEIEEWTVACAEPGYDIELSRSFFNFFVVGAAIGIIMFIYQACRYNNIRTTKLGKSIWKFMEVKDDSYFENELKKLDCELEQSCSKKIKTGEIALTRKWLIGKGNFWRIDAVPIRQIQSIEAKLQLKITSNASGGIRTYRSPALLVILKNEDVKGFFISDIDYGNEIVKKVKMQINNEIIDRF